MAKKLHRMGVEVDSRLLHETMNRRLPIGEHEKTAVLNRKAIHIHLNGRLTTLRMLFCRGNRQSLDPFQQISPSIVNIELMRSVSIRIMQAISWPHIALPEPIQSTCTRRNDERHFSSENHFC